MRRIALVFTLMTVLAGFPVLAASSYLGPTGNIATPDALVVPAGTWELAYHQFIEVFADVDLISTSVNYGLTPNFEVGGAWTTNGDDDFVINGKYVLLNETATGPAVAVGVFDAVGTLNLFGDDPGFYVVATKNIGPTAPVVGEPFRQARLSLGAGSGVFDGFFANLDWVIATRAHILLEFMNNDFAKGGTSGTSFNAGLRYGVTENLTLDAATIDFEDIALGVSYRTGF